jgi:20S proteasome alpha/beta subunit
MSEVQAANLNQFKFADAAQRINALHSGIAADFANTLVRAIRIGELLSEQRNKSTSTHTFAELTSRLFQK